MHHMLAARDAGATGRSPASHRVDHRLVPIFTVEEMVSLLKWLFAPVAAYARVYVRTDHDSVTVIRGADSSAPVRAHGSAHRRGCSRQRRRRGASNSGMRTRTYGRNASQVFTTAERRFMRARLCSYDDHDSATITRGAGANLSPAHPYARYIQPERLPARILRLDEARVSDCAYSRLDSCAARACCGARELPVSVRVRFQQLGRRLYISASRWIEGHPACQASPLPGRYGRKPPFAQGLSAIALARNGSGARGGNVRGCVAHVLWCGAAGIKFDADAGASAGGCREAARRTAEALIVGRVRWQWHGGAADAGGWVDTYGGSGAG
ncbi:hypothetical protein GGX14DRAFT_404274 [Mycena pura]|uniref:Uncharacterized protein n=1 Tax=Mycena pura TaxID=153505 RepID=A0AAD6UUF2_9AGAR|nr:hypothetical protein GGX14DRAFT_404274 [Mycena pura]